MSNYQSIPLSELHVSPLNARPSTKMGDIDHLTTSIKSEGLIHPLVVRKNDAGYEILAGQRRYAALCNLRETGDIETADCSVVDVNDAGARSISLSENIYSEDLSAIDQWKAFTNLIKEGWTVKTIAEVYGQSQKDIERTLALGGLPKYVLEAYENDDIDDNIIKILAIASKNKLATWGKLYRKGDYNARHLYYWVIVGGESGPGARRMNTTWMGSIRKQCREQKVPFFFKQWGGKRGKGGCQIFGNEHKEWPENYRFAAPLTLQEK